MAKAERCDGQSPDAVVLARRPNQFSRRDIGVRSPAPGRSRRARGHKRPDAAPCDLAFRSGLVHELEGVVGVPVAAAVREAVVPDGA